MTSSKLFNIIRIEIEDYLMETVDTHTIENIDDNTFHLYEDRPIISSIKVYLNNVEINSWSYDSEGNTVLLESGTGQLVEDILLIKYNCYKNYSDSLLKEYIKGALNRITLYYHNFTIEDGSGGTFIIVDDNESASPEIEEKEYSLVAIVTAILIKPDWQQYRAQDITIVFKEKMSKDAKIKKVIDDFRHDRIGVFDILEENEIE